MTERKDLVSQDYGWFEVYDKEEADQVMDSLEARIKELEATFSKMETPGWVYLDDVLPNMGQDVLVIRDTPDNNDGCTIARRVKSFAYWEWHLVDGVDVDWTFFTHWMPLPPPPTKEGK